MSHARLAVCLLLGVAALSGAPSALAEPPLKPGAAADPSAASSAAPPLQTAAPESDRERTKHAMALHDEAWKLYEQGHYRAAIQRLEAAVRLDPSGHEIYYNLALIHEKLGDLDEAAAYYRSYLENEPEPKVRARIQATLRRIEGAAKEAAAQPLAPRRSAAPPPPPPPRPVRPWVIGTGTVAGAALVVGAAFGFTALAKNPGPNARTGDGVTVDGLQSAAHTAHTDAIIADVSFLVSAAATGAAAFLYFSTPRRAPETSALTALPPVRSIAFGPGAVEVRF